MLSEPASGVSTLRCPFRFLYVKCAGYTYHAHASTSSCLFAVGGDVTTARQGRCTTKHDFERKMKRCSKFFFILLTLISKSPPRLLLVFAVGGFGGTRPTDSEKRSGQEAASRNTRSSDRRNERSSESGRKTSRLRAFFCCKWSCFYLRSLFLAVFHDVDAENCCAHVRDHAQNRL